MLISLDKNMMTKLVSMWARKKGATQLEIHGLDQGYELKLYKEETVAEEGDFRQRKILLLKEKA